MIYQVNHIMVVVFVFVVVDVVVVVWGTILGK